MDIPTETPKRISPMKGKHHDPNRLPGYKKKAEKLARAAKSKILVENLAAGVVKDALAGTIGKNDKFLASLGGMTLEDRQAILRISGNSVEAFNAQLKAQLGLAAAKLSARMAGDDFVQSLRPGEVAFAMTTAVQANQKIGAQTLTQGNITQVNVFASPDGRTKSQIIRALQGLPEEIEVKANP